MKCAIITGATGFVGRSLVKELLRRDIPVIAVIRPDSSRRSMLPLDERIRIVPCAMGDYEKLAEQIGPQEGSILFHLAWEGVYGPKRTDLNIQMSCVVDSRAAVIAAATLGCTRFVGLGSIMEKESMAVAEADGARPGMPYIYGEAKHMAHLVTKAEASRLGIEHLWPILTNPYGEGDDSTRFINATLKRILHDEPLEFSAGTQRYDFIHIEDAVKGLIAVAERGTAYHSYMLGSGKAAPLRSFIETIGRETAPGRELIFGNVPYTGVQLDESVFSIEALTRDTGFVPEIPFEDGIRRTMAWLRGMEGK